MTSMFRAQGSRGAFSLRPRPKLIFLVAFALVTVYLLSSQSSHAGYRVVPWREAPPKEPEQKPEQKPEREPEREPEPEPEPEPQLEHEPEQEVESETEPETEPEAEPEAEPSEPQKVESEEEKGERLRQEHDKYEQGLRDQFAAEYEAVKNDPGNDAIYGNTLATLVSRDIRTDVHAAKLRESNKKPPDFALEKPFLFNPYPAYHSREWRKTHRGEYIACQGANRELAGDVSVFKGHPYDFPSPAFGNYDILGIDGNLCFERETRLGGYGLNQVNRGGRPINWDEVNWGRLQAKCLLLNQQRYDLEGSPNPYVDTVYPELFQSPQAADDDLRREKEKAAQHKRDADELSGGSFGHKNSRNIFTGPGSSSGRDSGVPNPEPRTAILLRSYTGKTYTENDMQNMRALITELALRSGGEYHVYLLLHVRDSAINIFGDRETYQYVLNQNVPKEFHGVTILWNDQSVWDMYPKLTDDQERSVHSAQWLSVQQFSLEHPEYEYVWNWEMDARYTGHHYDFLEKLDTFSRKQPRRGLWERNERYYIPSFHGNYNREFRADVESRTKGNQVWGPPDLPFINPVGPRPPVATPEEDNYEWGVGEDADLITVGPIFDPVNSEWVIRDHIWGYSDNAHDRLSLPRRTTIVTQSRVSKRLLDMMHVENLRGNHIASEMTPQTVALLHSFKTVFAPHPVWFDRPWNGTFLAEWFNPGPRGESGGEGSPMGWGRERRYQGSTWYYRTEAAPRLYNNWMGYEDTQIGGQAWEEKHGRPCLPPMMLHPIKDVHPTAPGFESGFDLFYG